MKTKLTVLLAFILMSINAQDDGNQLEIIDNPNYNNFKELNLNNIPTGVLLDYGYPQIDVTKFNGIVQDSTYTNKTNFTAIYYTLLSSIVKAKNNLNNTTLLKQWQQLRKANTITLAGVLFNYNMLNEQAVRNGTIQVIDTQTKNPIALNVLNNSGQLPSENFYFKENPNPPTQITQRIPTYLSQNAFAIAPSINVLNSSNFSVVLPNEVFATNISNQLQDVFVNFSDGKGYQKITFNTPIQVNYTQKNTYTWVYKAVLTNGTVLYSHSKVKINQVTHTNVAQRNQGIIEDRTYIGSGLYKAFIEINYADDNDRRIKKPLIIAEGLDTGIVTSPENQAGENNLNNFVNSYQTQFRNLREKLDEYDIIYVNWHNGLGDIVQNAAVLKEVIRRVNLAKVANNSTEKNVVLGQSMGGLIARYALKDIEDNNEPHDTRLYISHDAPHQGANAPISVQYLLRHIRKIVIRNPLLYTFSSSILPIFNDGKSGYDYYNIIDNPATRQMMINWVNKDYQIDNSYHNAWQNKLKAKGYPQQTKNVAIANGSVCGDYNTVEDTILGINETLSYHSFSDIISAIIGLQNLRLDLTFLSSFPGKQTYKFFVDAKPVIRNGAGRQIYQGLISYKKKILWFIPVTIHLTNKKINQPSGLLPYDELPGSNFSLSQSALPSFLQGIINQNPSSFIPNLSALDYGRGTINHSQSVYENILFQNNSNIPFSEFILDNDNRQHITFSNRNSRWLINQLDESTNPITDCANFCTKIGITGEDSFCASGSYSFNTSLPVTWSISEGNNIVSMATNGNNVTLTRNDNFTGGYVTLNARTGNTECGIRGVSKRILVRVKPYKSRMSFNRYVNYNFQNKTWNLLGMYYNGNLMIGDFTWEWQVPSSMIKHTNPKHSYINFRPNVNNTTQIYIIARAYNECGYSGWKGQWFNVIQNTSNTPCGGAGQLPCKDDIIEF